MRLSKLNLARIRATPEGGDRRDWPKHLWPDCHQGGFQGHTDVYGRLRWDKTAPALTTKCISYSNGRFGHPDQDRALSAREAARLQTFPIEFRFTGSLASQARQIGNAVPVALARRFGHHLMEHVAEFASSRTGSAQRLSCTERRWHSRDGEERGMTAFKARARAVDMLGRQQIANLPTALSELFKNAHDAYATTAIADFFRAQNVLVVSDDGVGMDRDTFERSWLTIATESKLEPDSTPRPAGMSPRVQLGEKGIGRFAIGALGSQVLVVSKTGSLPCGRRAGQLEDVRASRHRPGRSAGRLDRTRRGRADRGRCGSPQGAAVGGLEPLQGAGQREERSPLLDDIEATLDALPDDPLQAVPGLGPLGPTGTMFLISSVSEDLAEEIGAPDPKMRRCSRGRCTASPTPG